jgi:hypothetical protein
VSLLCLSASDRKQWKSKAYDHFNIKLERHLDADGEPHHLEYKFSCRFDPTNHGHHVRKRMATGHGTQNLNRGIDQCLKNRNLDKGADSHAGAQQTLHKTISTYTPSAHRALIALHCAVSKRPFEIVRDPHYMKEVEMLRPGTVLPSPRTVSRDVNDIYKDGSVAVREYFSVSMHNHLHISRDRKLTLAQETLRIHPPGH